MSTPKPVAIIYTCRNPGQVALLWTYQPPPFGHGWIDVKQEPLVRLSDVEAIVRNGEKCVEEFHVYESALGALLPGPYYMDPPDGGDVTLIEQLQRMAQDAARYRWLCDGNGYFMEEEGLCGHDNEKSEADRQIDIAMTTGERP